MLIKGFAPLKVPRGILLAAALAAFLLAIAAIALIQPAQAQTEETHASILIPHKITDTSFKVKIANCERIPDPEGGEPYCPVIDATDWDPQLALLDSYYRSESSPVSALSVWYGEFAVYLVFDDTDLGDLVVTHCQSARARSGSERTVQFSGLQPNTEYRLSLTRGPCLDPLPSKAQLDDVDLDPSIPAPLGNGGAELREPFVTTSAAQTSNIVVVNPPAMRVFRVGPWGFRVEVEHWDRPWSVRAVTSEQTNPTTSAGDRCIEGDGHTRRDRIARFEYSRERGDLSLANGKTYTVTLSDEPCDEHDSDDPLASLTQTTTDISLRASHVGARSARLNVDGRRETDSAWSWWAYVATRPGPGGWQVLPNYDCVKVTGDWIKVRNLPPGHQVAFQASPYPPDARPGLICATPNLEPQTFTTKSLVGFSLQSRTTSKVTVDVTNPPSGNYYWSSSQSGCNRVPSNDRIVLSGLDISDQPLIGIYLTPQCGWDGSEGIESTNPDRFGAQNVWRAPKHESAPQIDVHSTTFPSRIRFSVENHVGDYWYIVERRHDDQTSTIVRACTGPVSGSGHRTVFFLPPNSKFVVSVYAGNNCSGFWFDVATIRTN